MSLELECPKEQDLVSFVLGKLARAHADRITSHLEECSSCRTFCQDYSFDTAATPASFSEYTPEPTMRIRNSDKKTGDFSFLLPPVEPDEIGRLGNYRILGVLGQGGMGVVFRAEDIGLKRLVALKIMRPELQENRDGWERFTREFQTMAQIKHDNLVTIYQTGKEAGVTYFAMELLDGESLDDWRKHDRADDCLEIVRIGLQIATGLAFIHRKGLVHRDIKPANIWVEAGNNRVKILDLGLVLPVTDAKLTATGTVMGTPDFMAPEQARGDPVDARADLFSLGGVLYYLCTGRKPFLGHTASAVLMALASETPPPASSLNPKLPEALSDLLMELLARNPDKRPASAQDVITRLEQIESVLIHQLGHTMPIKTPAKTTVAPREARRTKSPRPPQKRIPIAWIIGPVAFVGLALSAGCVFFIVQAFLWRPRVPPPPPAEKVFLTDMKDIDRRHWPSRLGPPDGPKKEPKKKGPKGKGGDIDTTVRFRGENPPHGIFMHPPTPPFVGEPASLTYNLGKRFRTFETEVSINDGQECREAPCIFSVYGDGKLLWQSQPVWSQKETQKCSVPVRDVDQLKIAVTCAGEPFGAHAIWIESCVVR